MIRHFQERIRMRSLTGGVCIKLLTSVLVPAPRITLAALSLRTAGAPSQHHDG